MCLFAVVANASAWKCTKNVSNVDNENYLEDKSRRTVPWESGTPALVLLCYKTIAVDLRKLLNLSGTDAMTTFTFYSASPQMNGDCK